MKTKYDGLIFDMDGVLVDVSKSYREAIRQTVSYFLGKNVLISEVDKIKNKVGMNNDWDASYALINKQEIGLINNEKLFVSKQKLQLLKKRYKKLGIATGRPKVEANYVIKKNKLQGIFDCIISMEDVSKGKPEPDMLLAVIRKLKLKNTVYIGDSPNDVIASEKANISSIYVGNQNIGTIKFQSILQVINYLL